MNAVDKKRIKIPKIMKIPFFKDVSFVINRKSVDVNCEMRGEMIVMMPENN